MKDLLQLQLNQLERLMKTKKVRFEIAHYVIFSDYPTKEFFHNLVLSTGNDFPNDLHDQFVKHFNPKKKGV